MSRIYISDTNIWIDFRHAGLLNELFRLPFTLCCTDFVLDELNDFNHETLIGQGLQIEALNSESIARLSTITIEHNNSSLADISCYLLAKDTGRPLLTGDGQLRRQAQRDGLQVYGALWLLDRLVENCLISTKQAADGLDAMLAFGARLPQTECNSRIACVFRGKLDTHSTANRSPIPWQTGHPVQRKLDSNSASNWTV